MKRFYTAYVEITNICNLSCSFCPGTKRIKEYMPPSRFEKVLKELIPYTDFVHLHVLGEPLLHPELFEIIKITKDMGMKVCITTNGTLLNKVAPILEAFDNIHKVSISLQALEVNKHLETDLYLNNCFQFGLEASKRHIVSYRLWNEGGADKENAYILTKMHEFYPGEWKEHHRGYTLTKSVYLEEDTVFDWPMLDRKDSLAKPSFCYGLRTQIGVLVDGTVVPCCLDHEGDIALGNILTSPLCDILSTKRAINLYQGFSNGQAVETLCKTCGFATRFN